MTTYIEIYLVQPSEILQHNIKGLFKIEQWDVISNNTLFKGLLMINQWGVTINNALFNGLLMIDQWGVTLSYLMYYS